MISNPSKATAASGRPTHPGEILKEDILPSLRLSGAQFAKIIGLSRQHVARLLDCEASITPETAVKLGALFNNEPQFWLNLQDRFDIWKAEARLAEELEAIAEVRVQMVESLGGTATKKSTLTSN
jgi:addiction module HigA family antidote